MTSSPQSRGTIASVMFVVGIGGGTASGKTTFAHALADSIGRESVIVLPLDCYYRDRSHLSRDERELVNYDHPDAIETDLLVQHLSTLRSGRTIERPSYDFGGHVRLEATVAVTPKPIVLVEGVTALVDPGLLSTMDLKIYVDADADFRLLRRIERDVDERGRDWRSVLRVYVASVRPMHTQFVEPTRGLADIVVRDARSREEVEFVADRIRKSAGLAKPRLP